MLFTPTTRAVPYETLGYVELLQALTLIQLPLEQRSPGSFEIGSPAYRKYGHFFGKSETLVRISLADGRLSAFVQPKLGDVFYRVPSSHWRLDCGLEGAPGINLFCFDWSQVPEVFRGLPLLFFNDEVQAFLMSVKRKKDEQFDDEKNGSRRDLVSEAEIISACDALWLDAVRTKDFHQELRDNPRFEGVTVQTIEALTKDRYKRIGKGGRPAREAHLRNLKK